jgi:hypothetical protein
MKDFHYLTKVFVPALSVLFFLSTVLYGVQTEAGETSSSPSVDTEKAEQLGEEFQNQMPGARSSSRSSDSTVIPQPDAYSSPEEKKEPDYNQMQYPLCYNPATGFYEYCYAHDSDHFRLRFRSSDFKFWWEKGRKCPSGFHFKSGQGCFKDRRHRR